jgi:hypothetical protein
MIRGGFLSAEDRRTLIAMARDGFGGSNSHFGILRLWTAFGPLSAPTQ